MQTAYLRVRSAGYIMTGGFGFQWVPLNLHVSYVCAMAQGCMLQIVFTCAVAVPLDLANLTLGNWSEACPHDGDCHVM